MLDALAIGLQDRVVEFAPGLGITAKMVLQKHPLAYWGVEREPAAVGQLRRRLAVSTAEIVPGRAEESGLPDACASAVYGEALLSMQNQQQKNRVVAEACRLLATGGRYGIHELCFLPDDIPDHLRQEIQAAMSKEIHVGVQPLCRNEWTRLFDENGLKVTWSGKAPMHLLEPRRLLQDEGLMVVCALHFAWQQTQGLAGKFLPCDVSSINMESISEPSHWSVSESGECLNQLIEPQKTPLLNHADTVLDMEFEALQCKMTSQSTI